MHPFTGYIVLENDTGTDVTGPSVTVTANGNSRTPINLVSLNNGASSGSTQYFFAADTPDTFAVSFTPAGATTPTTGTVPCNLAEVDKGKKLTVKLSASDFTVHPPKSPSATGSYDTSAPAPAS